MVMDGAGGNHRTVHIGQWELWFRMTAVLRYCFRRVNMLFTLKQTEGGEEGGEIGWRYLANMAAARQFFFNLLLKAPSG